MINNETVEIVHTYKYLGFTVDDKLNWHEHCNELIKKINKRMYFLRKLKSFKLNNEVLYTFYCSILGSVITFGISCWGSSIIAEDRKRLNSTIKKAGKIMNREVPNIETLFHTACLNKYNSILKDNDHPLNCNFITSMRSNRIIQPKSRTERYRLSLIYPNSSEIKQNIDFLSTDCYQIVAYYINITINLFVTENVCVHM